MVYKTLMDSAFDRSKVYIVATFVEYRSNAVGLLFRIRADVYSISIVDK